MSRTAFVSYGDDGFWAYDVALSIFLKHLIDIAEPIAKESGADWLKEEIHWWRVIAGPCAGTYSLTLAPSWSAAQRELFVEMARRACDAMTTRKEFTEAEIAQWPMLDDVCIFTRGADVVETAPVIELGKAIVALADGSLPAAPPGNFWFYGTPEGRRTIGRAT